MKLERGLFGTTTLGALTEALEKRKPDECVRFDFCSLTPHKLMSYRGFYDHLALTWQSGLDSTVERLVKMLREADGATFQGYKGGDFVMGKQSPIWVAQYGDSGSTAIVGISDRCDYMTIIKTKWVSV